MHVRSEGARVHALRAEPRGSGNHRARRLLLSAQGGVPERAVAEAGLTGAAVKQTIKAFPNVPSLCASILLGCTLAIASVQASASEGTEGKAQQLKQQHLKSVGSRAHK